MQTLNVLPTLSPTSMEPDKGCSQNYSYLLQGFSGGFHISWWEGSGVFRFGNLPFLGLGHMLKAMAGTTILRRLGVWGWGHLL